jgi:hypothetical protein
LAVEAAQKGFVGPMNMFWIWLISSNQVEKSREMMSKYLREADGLLFRSILRKIREASDVSMAEEVMSQVSNCAVSSKSRGVVLSALIDAHGESNVLRNVPTKRTAHYTFGGLREFAPIIRAAAA